MSPATSLSSLVLSLLIGTAAAAAPTVYRCNFEEVGIQQGGNWIPRQVVLIDDPEGGRLIVSDPIIMHYYGAPIDAVRGDETKSRISYTWTVRTTVRQKSAQMNYRLTYFRNGNPARMKAMPGGYDNSFDGDGTCTVGTR